jgi:hypothetical protein
MLKQIARSARLAKPREKLESLQGEATEIGVAMEQIASQGWGQFEQRAASGLTLTFQ